MNSGGRKIFIDVQNLDAYVSDHKINIPLI